SDRALCRRRPSPVKRTLPRAARSWAGEVAAALLIFRTILAWIAPARHQQSVEVSEPPHYKRPHPSIRQHSACRECERCKESTMKVFGVVLAICVLGLWTETLSAADKPN